MRDWINELTDESTRDQAIEDLRHRLQQGLYYYLRGELLQLSEDFAQDATIRVLANLGSFRGDSQFTTWAVKIAENIAISKLRRAHYRSVSLDQLLERSGRTLVNKRTDRPETMTEKHDILQRVTNALGEVLSKRQRAALEAIAVHELPVRTVAEQMGLNSNALYKLVFDARQKMRANLLQQGITPEYIMNLFE
jgi:RNA polymerase sigma-70 factor, ECF subfamily